MCAERRADRSSFLVLMRCGVTGLGGHDVVLSSFLDLIDQKRLDEGMERQREILCQSEKLTSMGSLLAGMWPTNGVDLAQEMGRNLPSVLVDEGRMHQVLTNLLLPVQQALRGQEGPKRLGITVGAEGAVVVLTMEDNGPAVPEANRSRIFEPFFTTKPIGVRTGLGLALCHAIATTHGTMIAAENAAGGVACFVIRLRGVKDIGAKAGREPAAVRAVVLPVDDEPAIDGRRLQSLVATLPDPSPFLFSTGNPLSAGRTAACLCRSSRSRCSPRRACRRGRQLAVHASS